LVGQSTDFVLHAAIESLSTALKIDARSVERRLKAFVVADWRSEPFSLGAYSYVPVDAITASVALAEPVANTLFFAGEATNSDGNAGTMHGAIASGYRAADELLKSFHIRAA
jgi:monoamine oxidase